MTSATETTANTWIVCHRHFDTGQVGHYAFSSQEKACLHAARLIAEELPVPSELDERTVPRLIEALATSPMSRRRAIPWGRWLRGRDGTHLPDRGHAAKLPVAGESGKARKGPGYTPPDLATILVAAEGEV